LHRFEKVSNIIKRFKLTCTKLSSQFQGMVVGNSVFTSFVENFTSNTYLMVITSDPAIRKWVWHACWRRNVVYWVVPCGHGSAQAAVKLNIAVAKDHFEAVVRHSGDA
jgi:hypothetical protein